MPDLNEIPGLPELWTHTLGDSRVTIAVIEGPVELERACFKGANLTKIQPYWQEDIEIDPKYIQIYLDVTKEDSKRVDEYEANDLDRDRVMAKREAQLEDIIPTAVGERLSLTFHANHICSTIFGQHGSPVGGVAPNCRGINIPIGFDNDSVLSSLNLTRAIDAAVSQGANIIHISVGIPTTTGEPDELLARAVRRCRENNILIVAPSGNDKGEWSVIPSILKGVLAVGAMKDNGQPFKFSNWGGLYQQQGILAPGENILGANVGTDEPVRKQGTSCSAPIVTGIAGLLASLQLQRGEPIDPEAVKAAILNSAIPCDVAEIEETSRCMRGKLNIPGALKLMGIESLTTVAASNCFAVSITPVSTAVELLPPQPPNAFHRASLEETARELEKGGLSERGGGLSERDRAAVIASSAIPEPPLSHTSISAMSNSSGNTNAMSASGDGVTPSEPSNLVYALGTIGYDFGSEARRDSFKQLMPAASMDGILVPANPYDARQIVDYLGASPSEGKALIWTLNQELTPIYAIEPVGSFGADVYDVLQQLLAGQVLASDSSDYIERASIPGWVTDKTVTLLSGQVLPAIKVNNIRGIYGWKVNALVAAAQETVRDRAQETPDEEAMQRSLTSFLNRIYYDLRSLGQLARDRALNFAATNAFQAASTFAPAVATGMELDSIDVEKSPFCRINSDCWDVKLKFFDPENSRRAKKVYRFTIDVSDNIPVTLGEVRSWSTPY